jgi:tetratricopeptide (TPR) repeat protein
MEQMSFVWRIGVIVSAAAMCVNTASQISPEASEQLSRYFPNTNIRFVDNPTELQNAIVTCYAIDEEGHTVDGSQGLVIADGLVLTSIMKFINAASIAIEAQCCESRDAEGIVAFDMRTGLAYVSVPGIEAKPYTGEFEPFPASLPDSFSGIYGLPFQVEDGGAVATMTSEVIADWKHGSYPRTAIINNSYKSLGAGGLILGPQGIPCGMVVGGAGGSHAISGGSDMGVVPIANHDQLIRLNSAIKGTDLIDAAPDDIARAIILVGRASHARMYNPAQALDIAKSAVSYDDTNSQAWYELGVCHDLLGDKDEAIAALQNSVVHDPTWAESWYSLGLVQLTSSYYDFGSASFRNATRHNRFHTDAYGMLGLALMRLDSSDEAIEVLIRACELQPSNPQFAHNLSVTLKQLDRDIEIPAVWMRYVDSNRDDPRRWLAALIETSRYQLHDEFIDIAQNAQDLFGEDDILFGAIALKHLLLEEFDLADEYAQKAIAIYSDDYLANTAIEVLGKMRADEQPSPPPR